MTFLHITDYDDTISPRTCESETRDEHIAAYRDFMLSHPEIVPVISSGRVVSNVIKMVKQNRLPPPRYIIGSVGVEIYDCAKDEFIRDWIEYLDANAVFDDKKVIELLSEYELQPAEQQLPFKVCYIIENASKEEIAAIRDRLWKNGVQANAVYSSHHFLDVIPAVTNKGYAGKFLAEYLGIPLANVAISGDSYNDADMFKYDFGMKIAPRNADKELIDEVKNEKNFYHAAKNVAFGTIEGLEAFLKKRQI